MPQFQDRLQELLDAYTKNEISESGLDELCELVKDANDVELNTLFESELRSAVYQPMNQLKLDRMMWEVLKRSKGLTTDNSEEENSGKVVSIGRQRRWWWAAAGIVLLLGVVYLMRNSFNETKVKIGPIAQIDSPAHDVQAPTVARAILKLDDGTIVYLDSAQDGSLAIQGNVNVVKTADGRLEYSGTSTTLSVAYNTVFNPRGSKVQALTLNDGTKVWLNAESSLTFPTSFAGNERKVSISGEAYFEVTTKYDARGVVKQPFIVSKNDMSVTVLGTHFNVNAYDGETSIIVTLLEGKVKTSMANGEWSMLNPGEQAQVSNNIKVVRGVNVEQVMAWKNGYFSFDKTDLQTVMKQIARWYDVDVSYEGTIPTMTFGGDISRNSSASDVLKILEKSKVHFRIEGKRIVVMP
jgi:ferric-dicitrate binding protein FerR (iron transport regulator)